MVISGQPAGVAEMLLQSHEGYIEPLPALPDAWSSGSYKGLVARGNFVCSVKWSNKQISRMQILSRSGGECVLKCNHAGTVAVHAEDGRKVKVKVLGEHLISFATKAGGTYDIRNL